MSSNNSEYVNYAYDKYKDLVKKFITKLENKDIKSWSKDWSTKGVARNYITKKPYSGINILSLNFNNNFNENQWLTLKQINTLGGKLNKGSKAIPIFFIKKIQIEEDNEKRDITVVKNYNVFNIEQTNINFKVFEKQYINSGSRNENIESYIQSLNIKRKFAEPSYNPITDTINLPPFEYFENSNTYYSTYFHEIGHASGNKNRLNRFKPSKFGDKEYAKEELVAELYSVYTAMQFGLEMNTLEDKSIAYLNSWIKILKENPNVLWSASSQASKSLDFMNKLTGLDFNYFGVDPQEYLDIQNKLKDNQIKEPNQINNQITR
jgi:antirestriction protein ArdC